MVNKRTVRSLALKITHAFCLMDVTYLPGQECWVKDLVSDGKAFCCEIPYKYVFEIAAHSLAAITQKLPSDELVKSVLQLAEQWAIASNGELVLIEEKGKPSRWYPLCLVESENPLLAYK